MSDSSVGAIRNRRQILLPFNIAVSAAIFDSITCAKVAATHGQIHNNKWHLGVQTESGNTRIQRKNWRAGKLAFHYRFLGNVVPAAKNFSARKTILAESRRSLNEPKASIFSVPGA
jgi:hypothetical protein